MSLKIISKPMEEELVRVSKLMSLRNICSRREAEEYIEKGQVLADGKIISRQGTKVSAKAKIELLKDAIAKQEKKVTILLNKPLGYVSNLPEKGYPPAIDLITEENLILSKLDSPFRFSHKKKLAVAGRLDIDSKGLLIFTQDGTIAKKLIGENTEIEKEYFVYVDKEPTHAQLKLLCCGLELDGKKLKQAKIKMINKNLLCFILKEGKKRQIRRMCDLVELKVTGLKRVRTGKVNLGDLPEGKWRYLQPNEFF